MTQPLTAETLSSARQAQSQPGLVYFHSSVSGRCRRVEGYLAQVLQRRGNHSTFRLYSVAKEDRPDLLERLGVDVLPTLVVVQDRTVRAKLEAPRSSLDIETFLGPWLRQ